MDKLGYGQFAVLIEGPRTFKWVTYAVGDFGDSPTVATLDLHSISQKHFEQIEHNDQIAWQHFKVRTGFSDDGDFFVRTLVVSHTEEGPHKLYFFHYSYDKEKEEGGGAEGISFGYIPLRKDGSVASNNPEIELQGKGQIVLDIHLNIRIAPSDMVQIGNEVLLILDGDKRVLGCA